MIKSSEIKLCTVNFAGEGMNRETDNNAVVRNIAFYPISFQIVGDSVKYIDGYLSPS